MNLAQLQRYASDPNVRKMFDLVAYTEGVKHGYNTMFGNQRIDNLSAHPNIRKQFKQTDGKMNVTTAAGRYQFLKPTWDGLSRQYGLKDFSPQSQDIAAVALLAQNGALPYVLKGDFATAIQKSGGTWASLPSSQYKQGKRSWNDISKFLGGNLKQPDQASQEPSRFLSPDRIAKVLPQLTKGQESQQRFLSPDRVAKVLPQLNQQPDRFLSPDKVTEVLPQINQQPSRFLNEDQIAKVLPQLAKG
ncbi:glycoside hydrolase family 104 protein [Acinetobacter sp. ANC 4218]|uniref:glycoside hydrolase family 24 protein n=1 Tax=Acinetobacter sp. ANC 4218 TaxID=1977880 RepID=UPI0020752612|nr:glycoside hydrolase family 104 protein [Acinetobacter sp. ANC 4218]